MKFKLTAHKLNVAGVLSQFTEMVDTLEAIAAKETKASDDKFDKVAALQDQIKDHDAEADRALSVAEKIKDLIAA